MAVRISHVYSNALTLLRNVLWQNTQHIREEVNGCEWEALVDFFAQHSLCGLLSDAIGLLPSDMHPSVALKMRIIARQLQVEKRNLRMNEELLSFTTELERRDIPYALLKGQGVASLYPNPLHRMSGDVDLYIPMSYYKEVCRGILSFGGVKGEETCHHVNYTARGVVWELHHCIHYFQKERRNKIFSDYVDKAMSERPVYATVGDGKVRVMPPTMNVLLLLAHILDHFNCSGVGLRQLCDYALLQHHMRKDIDKEVLLECLDSLSLTRSYRVFGYICTRYLGMPEEDLYLQPTAKDIRLAQRVMEDCLRGGNFGRSEAPSRDTLWHWMYFYSRFLFRLLKFRKLCPSEALWWPLAKVKRLLTGTIFISEEKSVLNRAS